MQEINFFGQTNFRNARRKFGIKLDDRRRHFYVIGKTGMGKTEMLKNMAVQDIRNGFGMGFVDPHGEAVEELLDFVPEQRAKDVVYFNPADLQYPISFNVMEHVAVENRHMVASGLMSVFKKIWPDVWSARMEYILNNVVLALLESPDSTLLGINRMLSDAEYRQQVVERVQDPVVKAFWVQEYSRYTQRYEVEATAAIQNKVGQFTSNPLIRNIVGQTRSSFDMRKVMDEQKILLVNISKGRIGEDNSRLLGGLMITKLQLAAMSRVDVPEEERKDFFLYIDEFQHFATESFVNILSEARKYRLSLILSHQYVAQLGTGSEAPVRDAVFGNVGTMVSFRVGAEDAEWLEKEFTPEFLQQDFVNLGKYTIYVKLMIDGVASRPFSASTLPPVTSLKEDIQRDSIIAHSREMYATPVKNVEDVITEWTGLDRMDASALPSAVSQQAGAGGEQVLYDARCSNCGRDTKVVFPPDGKRPVYCKSCRKKMQRQREEKPAPTRQESLPSDEKREEAASRPEPPDEKSHKQQRQPEHAQSDSEETKTSSVSLQEATSKEPVLFHGSRRQGAGRQGVSSGSKKEGDRAELQSVLKKALERVPNNNPSQRDQQKKEEGQERNRERPQKTSKQDKGAASSENNEGVLEPGETIYFDEQT